ncbi:MAG: hypothetical protein IH609_08240, partial [Dehalococcoidia bacterium]|nr:hypothetical protein [Dehalococcoidia bacterium]
MFPLSSSKPTRTLPWAIGAIVLLLAAIAPLFSEATVSLASSGKYIRLCMAAMPNCDDREQGGHFTFNFYADGSPVPFAALTMNRLEDPGIFCENLYPSDFGVADTATFVVKEAVKPPSWESKPDYPKYVVGNPPLVSGDTTPAFTIAAQWTTVTFYDWVEIAPRLTVCKGIEDNGDATVDSATFEFTVAVTGQAPFKTFSLTPQENQEEECGMLFLEDEGLTLPVTMVVTELPSPGFQNAPGYPKHYDDAVSGLVPGETVELTFDAVNREPSAWFMNKRAEAPTIPEIPDFPEIGDFPDIPQVPGPIETPVATPTPVSTATPPPPTATPTVATTSTPVPSTPAASPTKAGTQTGGNTAGATTTPLPPRTGNSAVPAGDQGLGILFMALAALSG